MTEQAFVAPAGPDPDRRFWLMATGAAGSVAAVTTAVPFVSTFTPSERAKAMGAAVEVDIGDLAPGALKPCPSAEAGADGRENGVAAKRPGKHGYHGAEATSATPMHAAPIHRKPDSSEM